MLATVAVAPAAAVAVVVAAVLVLVAAIQFSSYPALEWLQAAISL
jgi:hypothetical protein